ncbi:Hypothetical predicted protein [Cloeon dipterum]|uniref:Phospholipase A2 n=2 Tax=Cloeon dipterum TaxID=197152 RepID=A0A8S1CIS8_9INSE|nr:Hypothetical predicted protein [Cloeon dipterum]
MHVLRFLIVVTVPLVAGMPSTQQSTLESTTRGIFGSAFNLAKGATLAGANLAQEVASASTNFASTAAKEAKSVSKSVTGQARQGAGSLANKAKQGVDVIAEKAKEGAVTVVDKAAEGAKGAVNVAQVGAEETLVVISDPTQPIFPGTRWCGAGTKADNVTDVGVFKKVDKCCRSHDNCFDNIPASGEKHGLKNEGKFTRSHCDCDDEFYECLKTADNLVSAKVGLTYFNVLRPQCFREERPVSRCAKTIGVAVTKRCVKYEFSDGNERKWQWFDAKEF